MGKKIDYPEKETKKYYHNNAVKLSLYDQILRQIDLKKECKQCNIEIAQLKEKMDKKINYPEELPQKILSLIRRQKDLEEKSKQYDIEVAQQAAYIRHRWRSR